MKAVVILCLLFAFSAYSEEVSNLEKGKLEERYLAKRKKFFLAPSLANFKALFPKVYHGSIEKNRDVIRNNLRDNLIEVVGVTVQKEAAKKDLPRPVLDALGDLEKEKFYHCILKLAGNGQISVILMKKGEDLFQLENF